MIGIVDYGSGNTAAIADIYKRLKVPHKVTHDHAELREANRYILPGVGAFDKTMLALKKFGLINVLNEEVRNKGKLFLGICVGMQVLGDSSDEGDLPGLGWIPGHIRRIDVNSITELPKLPHMGWNNVQINGELSLFRDVDLHKGFYFLHSYFFDALTPGCVISTVEYGKKLPCGVAVSNIYGLQFHPEKSHSNGVAIFRNFANL